MTSPKDSDSIAGSPLVGDVRDPRDAGPAIMAARERTMSERLELALSWNAVAAELRAGVAQATGRTHRPR